jgi:hypothetical protein
MLALLKNVPIVNHPLFRVLLGALVVAVSLALHAVIAAAGGGLLIVMGAAQFVAARQRTRPASPAPAPAPAPADDVPDQPERAHQPKLSARRLLPLIGSLVLNFIVPLVAYRVFRPHVASSAEALALGAAIPVAFTLGTLAWRRRLDPLGLISVASFAISIGVSWLSGGSSLALELQDPVVTGILGLGCLISVAVHRPLHLVVVGYLGRTSPRFARIAADPAAQRNSRIATAAIGAILLAYATVITIMALTLPTGTFLALSRPVGLAVLGTGLLGLFWYRRKRQAHAAKAA